ncbi:MAG: penicillin-binding transpeptidase domain-containing protein, partial [Deinococcales bacterium]
SVSSNLAPHITWAVRNELLERFSYDRVFGQGGLRVYTTIDPSMQQAANEASRNALVPAEAQLAIVGLNPATGEVLAMVGEHIIEGVPIKEFNRAMAAERQPGSSFKPIVYATAIEQGGYTQADIVNDEKTSFPQVGQAPWEPANHDNTFMGLQSLRGHLNVSRNIPVAKLVEALSPQVVAARAHELGYDSVQPYLSLSLGAFEITPLKHASALGAFANGGVHVEPYIISRVEDADGNLLYEASPQRKQVWQPETAYIILDMMHGNVVDQLRGVTSFSSRANIEGRYVAGKTGTTNDERDIWFVGMTPGLVAAVWIGYDDNRSIPKRMELPDGGTEQVTSSRQPIYIWRNFVDNAIKDRTMPSAYEVPENIEFFSFDVKSGRPDPNGIRGAFLKGTGPSGRASTPSAEITITLPIDTRTGLRANESTPPEFVEWRNIKPQDIAAYYAAPPAVATP